jgi:P pilus assembly chaperone PapD
MKNLKLTLYSLVTLVLLFGIAGIGLGLSRFRISLETDSNTASLPVMEPPSPPPAATAKKLTPALPATPNLPIAAASPAQKLDPVAVAARQGNLRVSNPTEHPVRVALLSRQIAQKTYGEPTHWDFSPMEGGKQGLMLSLPQSGLKLKKGDILVAFAQDGSRLYWGPYVVGETAAPSWNAKIAEWQLVLQP